MKTKVKKSKKVMHRIIYCMMLAQACCLAGCNDENSSNTVKETPPFDPNQPVIVSGFTPESGGIGQRLVLYGQNFGNDPALVHVTVGGKEAAVIGVNGESLYCLVPGKAYAGNIEVRIGDKRASADKLFNYERKMVVSTLCGYRNERDDQGWKDGKFSECAGFRNDAWMRADPENPKHLFVSYDNQQHIYLINFEDSTVNLYMTRGTGNWDRIRSVDFTPDGKHMIISDDRGGENDIAVSILSKDPLDGKFKNPQSLASYKQCNGASVHPVNGELYFNSYEKSQFFRLDLNNTQYFGGSLGIKGYQELFKIQDNSWEFNIRIHPSGNYAYIVVVNQHYVLRTDYNWAEKKFIQPYVVCGEARASGWIDGVGSAARLNRPYQGVFVKNPEYAGRTDEYDFYFCDCNNHCIRMLTPEGIVSTFAGRGSSSINPNPYGYVEGDLRQEARFDAPTGLAYMEDENAFYVADKTNRRIRKIALEAKDE